MPLSAIALRGQYAHLDRMDRQTPRATRRPEKFVKPAYWNTEPPPAPQPPQMHEVLSPTRYGDWVKDGIAIDF